MIRYILIFLLLSTTSSCISQEVIDRPHCVDDKFDRKVNRLLSLSVTPISPKELQALMQDDVLLLDTRELEEYKTSHIPGATFFGYKEIDWSVVESIPLDQPIVVYCSIGYRSEKVGEKLQRRGFTNVSNLYGSIFEWVNQDLPIEDDLQEATNKVHTYNKRWSKWVLSQKAEKVW